MPNWITDSGLLIEDFPDLPSASAEARRTTDENDPGASYGGIRMVVEDAPVNTSEQKIAALVAAGIPQSLAEALIANL